MLIGHDMAADQELQRFQRWLQSELSETSGIDDPSDKERRRSQIEITISEVIRYRELIDSLGSTVSAPFVERESPVRQSASVDISPENNEEGFCNSCGARLSNDLEFCTVCGDF